MHDRLYLIADIVVDGTMLIFFALLVRVAFDKESN